MATPKSQIDKWKRKRWFTVLSPKAFEERPLLETPAEKPELVIGRTVKVFAREVSSSAKRSPVQLIFQVDNVQGSNAYTKVAGMQLNPGELRRTVRRRNSKVDIVQNVSCKDGVQARIHTVVVSANKLAQPQASAVYHLVRAAVEKSAKESHFDKLVFDISCGNKLNEWHSEAKKIAPVKRVEVVTARVQKAKA